MSAPGILGITFAVCVCEFVVIFTASGGSAVGAAIFQFVGMITAFAGAFMATRS